MADVWKLEEGNGSLCCGELRASLELSRPDLGVHSLHLNTTPLRGHLLAVQGGDESAAWPLPIAEAYVRGKDLVASYRASDDWPFSPQLYWSASRLAGVDDALASLALLISVETHLLDTWPRMRINARGAYCELLAVDSAAETIKELRPNQTLRPQANVSCILYRLRDAAISYVEIMPGNDYREFSVRQEADGWLHAEWQLFADFLEKGVIRRARLQSVFVPRENDVQLALQCVAAVERRPLPLTT